MRDVSIEERQEYRRVSVVWFLLMWEAVRSYQVLYECININHGSLPETLYAFM